MCGIAGILRVHPPGTPAPPPLAAIPESWLDILDTSIKHRGPDGQGRFRDRAIRSDGTIVDVALVHRRLSILDHAGGGQPMVSIRTRSTSEAGAGDMPTAGLFVGPPNAPVHYRPIEEPSHALRARQDLIAVAFNGCIYNHRELRKELQAAGHEFVTDHSDTEVLIHGWREWKSLLPQRILGMFAFALWDREAGQVILARDPFGEKPLYYAALSSGLHAFDSCIAGVTRLRRALGSAQSTAPITMARWLRFGFDSTSPTGETEVPRGYVMTINGHTDGRPYEPDWSPPTDQVGELSERQVTHDEVESAIGAAVAAQVQSDVPLGCFLSGGIDSSLIAVHAMKALGRLETFTVRMPGAAYDESKIAQRVASLLGTNHHTIGVSPTPAADLPRLITQLGLPFGDSSLLPSSWLCSAARGLVTVALGGEGGDELFLGYNRHRVAQMLPSRLPRLWKLIGRLPSDWFAEPDPKSKRTRLARLIRVARSGDLSDLAAIYPIPDRNQLFRAPAQNEVHARDLAELRWFDMTSYLPGDLLRKADTASMSVALELRSPLLDGRVAGIVQQAAPSCLMPGNQRKGLLRAIARKYLPSEIVDRPKQGFAIPIGDWFRSDYGGMKQLLLDHLNSADPWGPASLGINLNMKFVRQMLDEHMGTGMSGRVTRDHSQRLYMLLVLSIWGKWMGSL